MRYTPTTNTRAVRNGDYVFVWSPGHPLHGEPGIVLRACPRHTVGPAFIDKHFYQVQLAIGLTVSMAEESLIICASDPEPHVSNGTEHCPQRSDGLLDRVPRVLRR